MLAAAAPLRLPLAEAAAPASPQMINGLEAAAVGRVCAASGVAMGMVTAAGTAVLAAVLAAVLDSAVGMEAAVAIVERVGTAAGTTRCNAAVVDGAAVSDLRRIMITDPHARADALP